MKNASNETQDLAETSLFPTEPNQNVLSFATTLAELRRTVDPELIRQKPGRRDNNGHIHMMEYVEWHTVADILDEHAPNWAHTIKDIRPLGDIVTVTVAITIDGVTREGIGTGKAITETGIKKAEHDALKRAAVKFGIARELYKREFETQERNELNSVPAVSPVAASLGDLVTAKQLNMIRAVARENRLDAAKECQQMMGCSVEELSKKAASELIDHLRTFDRAFIRKAS